MRDFFRAASHQKCRENISIPPRQSGGKKKLSAVTMLNFTFSLLDFMPSSDDDSGFSSANNKTDGKFFLVIKSTQRVAFEQILPPRIMINGQLWKYGDRYGCFRSKC